MGDAVWRAVDDYVGELILPRDGALEAALDDAASAGLPPAHVSPLQGALLHLLARALDARRVLEVGTFAGYSTIWLARALPADGTVVSLELDETHAAVARRSLARAGVADRVELRVGPARDTLRRLVDAREGPFDLVFLDADKASNAEYLPLALELSRPGTLIVADNVVRGGSVLDADSADASVRGVRRFLELLGAERRVVSTVLQTVGDKGYDGFALALVVDPEPGERP